MTTSSRRLGSIDRFEGDVAILWVEGAEEHLPRTALPPQAREGDVVDLQTMTLVPEERERLAARVKKAREEAPSSGSGNFDL